MTVDLKRAGAPLSAASLKFLLLRDGVLGGGLTVAWACPGALWAGPLPRAAGQVVVRGGVPQLGAGLPSTPHRQASRGRLAQRQAALLFLGVQGRGRRRETEGVHLQGFGASAGRLHCNVLYPLQDLLPLCRGKETRLICRRFNCITVSLNYTSEAVRAELNERVSRTHSGMPCT